MVLSVCFSFYITPEKSFRLVLFFIVLVNPNQVCVV